MRISFITILSLLCLNSAIAGSNYTVQCPEKIAVTQTVSGTYSGWRSITTQPNYYLSGVTMFSGKPEEMASLKPDFSDQNKSTWKFSPNEKIYVMCEYNQTSVQLTQALSVQTTSCTVSYADNVRNSTGGYIPKQILCSSANS